MKNHRFCRGRGAGGAEGRGSRLSVGAGCLTRGQGGEGGGAALGRLGPGPKRVAMEGRYGVWRAEACLELERCPLPEESLMRDVALGLHAGTETRASAAAVSSGKQQPAAANSSSSTDHGRAHGAASGTASGTASGLAGPNSVAMPRWLGHVAGLSRVV